ADEAVTGEKLADGSIGQSKLAAGSVTAAHLTTGSIGEGHIQPGSIAPQHLKPGTFTVEHLEEGCINGEKLAPYSIHQEHLSRRIINPKHLTFCPVQTNRASSPVFQQFGLSPFSFLPGLENRTVTISFKEPFADDQYVIVVTSDTEGCTPVIDRKLPEQVTVKLVGPVHGEQLIGTLNWMACGLTERK
ncbi:WIAG-tail domain, partial [Paenibacillus larvae]